MDTTLALLLIVAGLAGLGALLVLNTKARLAAAEMALTVAQRYETAALDYLRRPDVVEARKGLYRQLYGLLPDTLGAGLLKRWMSQERFIALAEDAFLAGLTRLAEAIPDAPAE